MKKIVAVVFASLTMLSCVSAQGGDYWYVNLSGNGLVSRSGKVFSLDREYVRFLSRSGPGSGFESGWAPVSVENSKIQIVDTLVNEKGEFVFPLDAGFNEVRFLRDDRFLVAKGPEERSDKWLWGIVDREMNVVVDMKYRTLIDQGNGYLILGFYDRDEEYLSGVMDYDGKVLFPPMKNYLFDSVGEDIAAYIFGHAGNLRFGYMDLSGKLITAAIYRMAYAFSYGFAVVETDSGDFKVINAKKEVQAQFPPGVCRPFRDGLAIIYQNNRLGYVNTKGEIVVPLEYSHGTDFKEGYAVTCSRTEGMGFYAFMRTDSIDGYDFPAEYSIIDRTGQVLLKKKFHHSPSILKGDVLHGFEVNADGSVREIIMEIRTQKVIQAGEPFRMP